MGSPLSSSSSPPPQPPTTLPSLPVYQPSPKGILKGRRATAPEQSTDDPSLLFEGKRLRFRSLQGDMSSSNRSPSNSPGPLSFRPVLSTEQPGPPSSVQQKTLSADKAEVEGEDERRDELGTLRSDPSRKRKLVDINQGEELRESVERLERFCEASVNWSLNLETQGQPLTSTSPGSRPSRRPSVVSPRAFSPGVVRLNSTVSPNDPPSTILPRPSISISPTSTHRALPALHRRFVTDATVSFPFTDARRQSLPDTLQSAAASLVVMAGQPAVRSKSFSSHHRASISKQGNNTLPPLSATAGTTTVPSRSLSAPALPGHNLPRPPSMSASLRLPSFHDVLKNDGGPAVPSGATNLLNKFRRLSQPSLHPMSDLPPDAPPAGTPPAPPLSAKNLVRTYSSVLRDRLHSWEGLEGLVKDAEEVAEEWEGHQYGGGVVDLSYNYPPS